MPVKFSSNLSRNRYGVLYFRLAIPPDLRNHFAVKEIYRSLNTASVKDAALQAQALSMALKQTFVKIRQRTMTNEKKPVTTSISLDAVIKHAREKLYLRSRIQEMENDAESRNEVHRRDNRQHMETLAIVVKESKSNQTPATKAPSFLLSEVVEAYIRSKLATNRWTLKSEKEYRAIHALFIRIIGDRPMEEIDDERIIAYLEILKKLPPNINKLPIYIGKTIAEIIAMSPAERIGIRTINKNLERVSSLFKWAMTKKKYGVFSNPAVSLSLNESDLLLRLPFTTSDLVALFSSTGFKSNKFLHPYNYWLMPIALMTGARIGELCQLYLKNFVCLEGVHCIEISETEDDQRVKNSNAKRLVPIHDELIELGLLRYVQALREKKRAPISGINPR